MLKYHYVNKYNENDLNTQFKRLIFKVHEENMTQPYDVN